MSQEQNFFLFLHCSICVYMHFWLQILWAKSCMDWPCRCVTRVTFSFSLCIALLSCCRFHLYGWHVAQIKYSTPNHPSYQLQNTPLSLNSESWATNGGEHYGLWHYRKRLYALGQAGLPAFGHIWPGGPQGFIYIATLHNKRRNYPQVSPNLITYA